MTRKRNKNLFLIDCTKGVSLTRKKSIKIYPKSNKIFFPANVRFCLDLFDLLRFACPPGSHSVVSTSWFRPSGRPFCHEGSFADAKEIYQNLFKIKQNIFSYLWEILFRFVRFTALRLPFGLPCGREHFVVPPVRAPCSASEGVN